MSDRTYGEMPRAFLVKNKSRRSTSVEDNSQANMSSNDFDDRTSGEQPSQLHNGQSKCSVAEHDHKKNGATTEFTHQTTTSVIRGDGSKG